MGQSYITYGCRNARNCEGVAANRHSSHRFQKVIGKIMRLRGGKLKPWREQEIVRNMNGEKH